MEKSIYIFSDGELRRKGNTLYFEGPAGRKYVPVENVRELLIFGEVTINKKLLDFCSQQEILLHFFNYYGYYSGTFYPREHYNSGYMILRQAEHYLDTRRRIILAQAFVNGAVQNIRKVLTYYQNRGKTVNNWLKVIENLADQINHVSTTDELMAIEGNIRDQYYSAFDVIIEDEAFRFQKRTRRPPKNRLNALLSFGNSLLYTAVLSEIYKTHLDPRIGYLHTTNFRRFTLNLDVAEVFKPIIVDRVIFTLINKKMLSSKHFEQKLGGIILNEKGRQIFISEYENRLKTTIKHERLKRNVSYRQLMLLELYKIQKHIMGEKTYQPFIARWWYVCYSCLWCQSKKSS